MKYRAVIFDMDGVLVDSEHVITAAAMRCLAEHGVQAREEDFLPFRGTGEDRFIGGVAAKYGLAYEVGMKHRTYEIYLTIVDQEIQTYPGIPELLTTLRAAGLRTAVGSSADLVKVKANLPAAGISTGLFDTLVSGGDVTHKKPAPDLFLLAASRLGIASADCLVVEDALSGIAAARAAGMDCLAVSSSFPPAELRAAGALGVISQTWQLAGWLGLPEAAPA